VAAGILFLAGCTSRGMTVTSVPEGAEVSINRRVIGKTPIRVGFTHYGTYRIELRKEKYQVLVKEESVNPPVYGWDPPAFVADNLIPARLDDEVYLHYVLKPIEEKTEKVALDDRDSLLARAVAARDGVAVNPRTGQTVQIVLERSAKKGVLAAEDADLLAEGDARKPILDKPSGLAAAGPDGVVKLAPVVQKIEAAEPQGARLAEQYGVESRTAPDKRGAFVEPETPEKEAAARRVLRTPKEEELIYDVPAALDTQHGKKDAEKKKPAP
jgi:hypothetical protein